MNKRHIIRLQGGVARNPQMRLDAPADFDLTEDEHIAITGPNGAGKSLLVDMLTGKLPLREGTLTYDFYPSKSNAAYDNIRYMTFRDTYGAADTNYYYQQRWNAHEQDDVPEAWELLGIGSSNTDDLKDKLLDRFGIHALLKRKIISLSSGELRKFQLVKALLTRPRVLIIDNPFIGLDNKARSLLKETFEQISSWGTLQIIFVLSIAEEIPAFITHVIPVCGKKVGAKIPREKSETHTRPVTFLPDPALTQRMAHIPVQTEKSAFATQQESVIELHHINIVYDHHTILQLPEWTVRQGEKWALSGDNGAGKSTLLSLICADNPQSYACDITLFGRKRGSGESIWEIKKRIGYVSPEMHRAYQKNLPTIDIVASGLHDSIGLYRRTQPEQLDTCRWWMETFGIADLEQRMFLQLSSGEQRLVLLARAFVKDPDLLVLDEPLHGLDTTNRMKTKQIIEAFCRRENKTLIMVTHYENELPPVINRHLHLTRPT